jgi:hypothetical protein
MLMRFDNHHWNLLHSRTPTGLGFWVAQIDIEYSQHPKTSEEHFLNLKHFVPEIYYVGLLNTDCVSKRFFSSKINTGIIMTVRSSRIEVEKIKADARPLSKKTNGLGENS